MIKKIGLGVSAAILAASAFFAVQRVQGDEAARELYPFARKAADAIEKNNVADVEEYQQFIEECNKAIAGRKAKKCEELSEQVSEIRKSAEKLGESLKTGQELVEKYGGFSGKLEEIPEIEEGKELEQELSELAQALQEKDGEKIDSLSKNIKKAALQLNEKLQAKANQKMQQSSSAELRDANLPAEHIFANWLDKVSLDYQSGDYISAYTGAERVSHFADQWNYGQRSNIIVSQSKVEGDKGTLKVIVPADAADLEGKLENLYVAEERDKGTSVPCKVTSVKKVEEDDTKVNVYLVFFENYYGSYSDVVSESFNRSQFNGDLSNTSWFKFSNDSPVTGRGFYDSVYDTVLKAARTEGSNVVVAINPYGYIGNSSHSVQDIVKLAQANNVPIWMNNPSIDGESHVNSWDMSDFQQMTETTGGCFMNEYSYEAWASGSYVQPILYYLSQINGTYYEVQYESQMKEAEGRNIYVATMEDNVGCTQTGYWPDKVQTEKTAFVSEGSSETGSEMAGGAMETEAQEETAAPAESNGDYIFPDSSTRYLTEADVVNLSDWDKKIARNEIYARHGRKFNSEELQQYFNSKSWYTPSIEAKDFKDEMLNDVERYNTRFISQFENK